MNSLPFKITNNSNSSGLGAFKQGIPVSKGMFGAGEHLAIFNGKQKLLDVYVSVANLWEDGSIKWLIVAGIVRLEKNKALTLHIKSEKSEARCEALFVKQHAEELVIEMKQRDSFHISKQQPTNVLLNKNIDISLHINEKTIDNSRLKNTSYEYLLNGYSHQAAKVSQWFEVDYQTHTLDIWQELEIYPSSGLVLCHLTITNPAAAEHPNGAWDLGDHNSIRISELGLVINMTSYTAALSASELNCVQAVDTIFQASSGGEKWQNSIHVDHTNSVTLPFRGFRAFKSGSCIAQGDTIQPSLVCHADNEHSVFIEVKDFWQHFPSSISICDKQAKFSLLGSQFAAEQELQPGEQLTRQFSISAEPVLNFAIEPLFYWIDSPHFFPLFNASRTNNPFQALINKAINGSNSFFKKSEKADVYGWRHFGELYADHERGNTPQDTDFVSHYNNQYDPICGMLCQWVSTGDKRWKTLADDLAKHVANIDVYHTNLDKPEYSGGLFWHTDHYVQAYTATHRTYSTLQPNDVYQDHAGGGGPGGQHCYTNGLLLHYYLSGSETSRQALLSICDWITHYYEGDGTLVGALFAIKNAGNIGLKNVMTGTYPFDRGTANYLQAILDRFDLLGNTQDLDKCATIIANTVSPNDDISLRQLDDVEKTWFYTVFLQALCRFITVKERLSQNDADYSYAVKSLCHYVHWMIENEYVYLEKPNILEFPNDTWTGQDLRKLCVMNFAKAYFPSNEALVSKITELTRGIYERLSKSTEAETTRVLCLMMQNAHYDVYAALPQPMALNEHNVNGHRKRSFSVFLIDTLKRFSLARERSQLAKRFPKFQKWIGKP